MCLLVVAVAAVEGYPLVVAANRDERHDRPAAPLHWWPDEPDIAAGRDLRAGGTWFGVTASGRFASVLNDPTPTGPANPVSRGHLVPAGLTSAHPGQWLRDLGAQAGRHAGFHLLLGAEHGVEYCSHATAARPLDPGVHVADNAGLDVDDPRSRHARATLGSVLNAGADPQALLTALADDRALEPSALGTGHAGAGASSPARADRRPLFIVHPEFGTRCSTVLRVAADGAAACRERRFDAAGRALGDTVLNWMAQAPGHRHEAGA
jgi:uncharacterized protein with NRDE domain